MNRLKALTLDDDDLRTLLMCLTLIQTNAIQEIMDKGNADSVESIGLDLDSINNLIGMIQSMLRKGEDIND